MNQQDYIFCDVVQKAGRIVDMAAIRSSATGVIEAAFSSDGSDVVAMTRVLKKTVLGERFDSRYLVIAHHADAARSALIRSGEDIFNGRAWIDTAQLVWPLIYSGLMESRKLEDMAIYLDVPVTQGKGAEGNCTMLMRVFLKLMQRYRTALIGESALNELGGSSLKGIRSVLGF